jgi:hypothetical protein
MSAENKDKVVKSRKLLKRNCIRVERKGGKSVFVIPEQLAKTLLQNYKFSFDQLSVGGEIDLQDLALHMDGQGQLESEAGLVAEQARFLKEVAAIEYEAWYEKQRNKIRSWWYDKYGKWPTVAEVQGRLASGGDAKEWIQRQKDIASLEANYRILNNVIRSAIIVKGDMLRSMRPLLQSDGNVVRSISVRVAKKVRTKLIVQKDKSNGQEEKGQGSKKQKEKVKRSVKPVKAKGKKGKGKA